MNPAKITLSVYANAYAVRQNFSARRTGRLRGAVKRFAESFKHAPTLADLTPDALARFARSLQRRRDGGQSSIVDYAAMIRHLWQAAHEAGDVPTAPPDSSYRLRWQRIPLDSASTMPLTQFLANALSCDVLRNASPDYLAKCRRVAKMFVEFAGCDPPCAAITTEMLTEFESWLRKNGRLKSASRYRQIIGLLARTAGAETPRKFRRRNPPAASREPQQGELWHLFLTSYERRNRSSATTRFQYRVQLRHFANFLGHEPTLDDLNDDTLDGFVADRASKVAIPTANKAYWCVAAIWRHAYDLGLTKTRPTIQPLAEPENIPFAWLKEEIDALLQSCSGVRGKIDGVPARLWWLGIHWTIWSTGERVGAMLAVEKANCNLARGELYVPANVRKGRRKPKLYPLLPQCVEVLREMDGFDRKLLFPWSMDRATLYNRYSRILAAAKLPTDRKCKFHRMRRSFASYIEAAGGNATLALGHSTRRVAEKSYLDPRICGGQDVTKLLPAIGMAAEEEPYLCQLVEEPVMCQLAEEDGEG